MSDESQDSFYDRLREKLEESTSWPSDYLFKFIVPTDEDVVAEVHRVFDNTGAVINLKQSKNGKYTSISITVHLESPEDVIDKYKKVGKVKGVISL